MFKYYYFEEIIFGFDQQYGTYDHFPYDKNKRIEV
jgi:hypothetical protein